MKAEIFTIERDEALIKKQRYWYIPSAILLLVSVLTHQPVAFLAALFTFLIGFVPDIWYRQGLHHLNVRQKLSQQHLFFGEYVTLSVSVENRKLLPLPWLQVQNSITPPLTLTSREKMRLQKTRKELLNSTWQIWSYQRVTRRYRLHCQIRGLHVFGPLRMEGSDPFGWLECRADVEARQTLLVYPLIAPLEALGLSSLHPFGEYSSKRQLIEDPLRISGVRDYMFGDDPRRIHWKATARVGELRSKIYEPSSLRRLLVLLDTYNTSIELQEADTQIQELSISVAASIALWAIQEGYLVGLLVNSAMMLSTHEFDPLSDNKPTNTPDEKATTMITASGISVPFSNDPGHVQEILSTLACLVPEYHTPIEHIIETEETMFPLGTTVILVSAASTLSELTVAQLIDQRMRGAAIYLALTGKEEETSVDTYDLPVFYPGGREKWHELITTVHEGEHEAGTSSTSLQLD